jgi:hypothetical protein
MVDWRPLDTVDDVVAADGEARAAASSLVAGPC